VLDALSLHGGAKSPVIQVRLALQDSTAPNYQIVEIMDAETGQPMELANYSGKTYKELRYTEKNASAHWSGAGCTFLEVLILIWDLRQAAKS
jgi:hypothetical protein